jgi:hypothetical protein
MSTVKDNMQIVCQRQSGAWSVESYTRINKLCVLVVVNAETWYVGYVAFIISYADFCHSFFAGEEEQKILSG